MGHLMMKMNKNFLGKTSSFLLIAKMVLYVSFYERQSRKSKFYFHGYGKFWDALYVVSECRQLSSVAGRSIRYSASDW